MGGFSFLVGSYMSFILEKFSMALSVFFLVARESLLSLWNKAVIARIEREERKGPNLRSREN